jgi:hypothetical protein
MEELWHLEFFHQVSKEGLGRKAMYNRFRVSVGSP